MPAQRLQKIIAAAGIASRRKAEQLIAGGLVSLNGQVVTEPGTKADPEHDHIRVNGKLLRGPQKYVYLLMNKPKGYITAVTDPEKRPTVMDLLRGVGVRVYPVGRLDYATEGLLLLSNDGELAAALMKASSHVPKTYLVKVAGTPSADGLTKLRTGRLHPGQGRPKAEDRARQDQAHSRSRQSLVRSYADRRQEPSDPADVRDRRTSRGKNKARALRAAAA